MPSIKTTPKAASRGAPAKAQPDGRSRFSRAFGRFGAAQRAAASKAASNKKGGDLGTFLRDTRSELKKVEWPSREELTKLTAAVIGLSAVVGVFLGGVDYLFQEFFKIIIGLSGGGV